MSLSCLLYSGGKRGKLEDVMQSSESQFIDRYHALNFGDSNKQDTSISPDDEW